MRSDLPGNGVGARIVWLGTETPARTVLDLAHVGGAAQDMTEGSRGKTKTIRIEAENRQNI